MTAEFSRAVPLSKIAPGGTTFAVTATADECAVLAARMGIPAVHALDCSFTVIPERADPSRIQASGLLRARVTRECIVSAEEFETPVADVFSVIFVPEGEESEDPDPDMDDEIPYRGDTIDLGEAAAEQLALALDPYPRIEGATVPEIDPEEDRNPFAVLKERADAARKPH